MDGVERSGGVKQGIEGLAITLRDFARKEPDLEFNSTPALKELKKGKWDSITWIGHSSFLIQAGGINILTDPIWADYVGITKRSMPVPFPIERLPRIDYVLISHSHFDHLDFATLKELYVWKPKFLVPLGLKKLFIKKGFPIDVVMEKDWWETFSMDDVNYFQFVPAQHWSRRSLFDRNTTFWGGWMIHLNDKTIYFAGDTAYFKGFKQIGAAFPEIDYALMPIGAYAPEHFSKLDHINPEDAITAFTELGAETFIPMHYGTFRLGDDSGADALNRLNKEWSQREMSDNRKKIMPIGGTLWI